MCTSTEIAIVVLAASLRNPGSGGKGDDTDFDETAAITDTKSCDPLAKAMTAKAHVVIA